MLGGTNNRISLEFNNLFWLLWAGVRSASAMYFNAKSCSGFSLNVVWSLPGYLILGQNVVILSHQHCVWWWWIMEEKYKIFTLKKFTIKIYNKNVVGFLLLPLNMSYLLVFSVFNHLIMLERGSILTAKIINCLWQATYSRTFSNLSSFVYFLIYHFSNNWKLWLIFHLASTIESSNAVR